jgi:hypothetical protein
MGVVGGSGCPDTARLPLRKLQFLHRKITRMEDEPTMESIIRKLREIVADCEDPNDVPDPEAIPLSEEIKRTIRE